MAAQKSDLVRILSQQTGLTEQQAETFLDALPEASGKWLKDFGSDGPGVFSGNAGTAVYELNRQQNPGVWKLKISFSPDALGDFGDGSERFGLPVISA